MKIHPVDGPLAELGEGKGLLIVIGPEAELYPAGIFLIGIFHKVGGCPVGIGVPQLIGRDQPHAGICQTVQRLGRFGTGDRLLRRKAFTAGQQPQPDALQHAVFHAVGDCGKIADQQLILRHILAVDTGAVKQVRQLFTGERRTVIAEHTILGKGGALHQLFDLRLILATLCLAGKLEQCGDKGLHIHGFIRCKGIGLFKDAGLRQPHRRQLGIVINHIGKGMAEPLLC